MPSLLTVTGRDVLFSHWPVDPDALRSHVPDALDLDTYDGSAWVSALALEVAAVRPGASGRPAPADHVGSLAGGTLPALPALPVGPFPQLVLRTYVRHGDETGVYFLSVDSGLRPAATVGRRAFGLPFHAARTRLTRREDGTVTFGSRRRRGSGVDADSTPAAFELRYRPAGDRFEAEPGSVEAYGIERVRYFLPTGDDRRPGAITGDADDAAASVRVGRVDREPWTLRPVEATVRRNTLFEAAGLPEPTRGPTFTYSPGLEMGVEPPDRRTGH